MSLKLTHSIISGGVLNFHNDNASSSISKGFKILHRNIAVDAFHNSGERFDAPKCHPKTRLAVLEDIMRWIQDLADPKDILWLYGPAGAGKSAIAQTIAEMCAKLGLLIAGFFFSRASNSRNNEKRFMASIAYQLALSIPETRPFIESAVQIDPSIFDKSLQTQVEVLIILPLEMARSTITPAIVEKWPRLILIDGLDECSGHSIQYSIIHTLSTALLQHRVPLILFIASRPEPHIRNAFNASDISNSSHHIVLDNSYDPDADIKVFLLSRFEEIKKSHPLATFIPKSWPPAEIIDRLVQKSSGQFIYASTVMKYLDSPNHKPMKRLDVISKLIPDRDDTPYQQLDTLYTYIFSCVEDVPATLQIIGFLIFKQNNWSTPKFLESLFGLDHGDVYLCLSELHSILDIPPPTDNYNPIRLFHASLGDFLVDKLRSGIYFLDELIVHANIAQRCLPRLTGTLGELGTSTDLPTMYSIQNFLYHCSRSSIKSEGLKKKLMQINFYGWFTQSHHANDDNGTYLQIPLFFEWLNKAGTDGKLLSRVRDSWDRSLLDKLNNFSFRGDGIDIAAFLIFPRQSVLQWFKLSALIFPKYPDVLRNHFARVDSYSCNDREREAYRKLFIDFFEDYDRSGEYYVNGNVYACTALECIPHIFNLREFGMTLKPPLDTRSHFAVLDSFAILLSMASPFYSLYSVLRDHPLDPGAEDGDNVELGSLAGLKSAVETYLEKYETHDPLAKWQRDFSRSMSEVYAKVDNLFRHSLPW